MWSALQNVDWDLLHQQKLTLLAIRKRQHSGSSEHDALAASHSAMTRSYAW